MPRILLLTTCAALLCMPTLAQKKHKDKAAPTQDPITKGCITVSDIHYYGIWSTHFSGVQGTVTSRCAEMATVSIWIAYFGKDGAQVASDVVPINLAPHSHIRFENKSADVPTQNGYSAQVLSKSGSVIRVDLF